jgi:hypothetical protein
MKRTLIAVAVILIGSMFVSSADAQTVVYGRVGVAPAPTVVYYPWTSRAYVPAPVPYYTYRVGAPYVVRYPYPYYVGPRAVVRSKVYYPGQPVRNYWKAITW